jgi:primosomal protein N' (replication factor Y) (superfamily II helicase)
VVQIVGSGVSSIEKIAGKYRFFILLRAQKSTDLIKAARTCKSAIATIDMDPIEFA